MEDGVCGPCLRCLLCSDNRHQQPTLQQRQQQQQQLPPQQQQLPQQHEFQEREQQQRLLLPKTPLLQRTAAAIQQHFVHPVENAFGEDSLITAALDGAPANGKLLRSQGLWGLQGPPQVPL